MGKRFYRDQIVEDLETLANILNENDAFALKNEADAEDYRKDIDAETVMYDCDATDCKFWNEGFMANCVLHSVEIDAKHGCMQFEYKQKKGRDNDQSTRN